MLDLTPIFATFPILETERTILRAPTLDDADQLFALWSDPKVTRYLGRPHMTTIDEVHTRIGLFRTDFEQSTSITWSIINRADGCLIGTVVLLRISTQHHRAELGYELSPDWWGKGLITEVGSAVLAYSFNTVGLHSMEAHIDPENTGSRRVLEKLGFVQEGYFRENYYEPAIDRFTDTAVFSLLKSAWSTKP
jgi:[ribosomal protein S5]-alanine N-acetyltransferase